MSTQPVALKRTEGGQYSVLVPENFKSTNISDSDQIYSITGQRDTESQKYIVISVRKGSYSDTATAAETLARFDAEWQKGAFKTMAGDDVASVQKITINSFPARKVTSSPKSSDAKKNVMTSVYVYGKDTMYFVTVSTYDDTPKEYRNAVDDIILSFAIK